MEVSPRAAYLALIQQIILGLLPLVFCTLLEDAVATPKLAFCLFFLGVSWALGGLALRLPRFYSFYCLAGYSLVLFGSWLAQGLDEGGFPCLEILTSLALVHLWLSGEAGSPATWNRALVAGWWLTVLYSWMQRLHLDPISWSLPSLSVERTIAGLGNPNYLGFYLAVLAPLVWVFSLRIQRRAFRLVALGGWTLGILALILTATRASWLALAASGLVMALGVWRWHSAWRRPLAYCLLLLGVAAPLIYRAPISKSEGMTVSSRLGQVVSTSDQSSQARLMLWRAAAKESARKPLLGWGMGWFSYRALYHRDVEPMGLRPMQRRPENPHNNYLDILFNGGLLGLLCYLGFLGTAALRAVSSARHSPEGLAALAGLTAFAVNSFFICVTLPVGVAALWLAASVEPSPSRPAGESSGRWLGVLLGLFLAFMALRMVICDALLWQGDDLVYPYQAARLEVPPEVLTKARDTYGWATATAPAWRYKKCRLRQLSGSSEAALSGLAELCQRYPEDGYLWAGLASQSEPRAASPVVARSISRAWAQAVDRDPYNPRFHLLFSRWLWRIGDFDSALQEVELSLKIYPDGQEAVFHKALTLHSLGREPEALKIWEEVMRNKGELEIKRPW